MLADRADDQAPLVLTPDNPMPKGGACRWLVRPDGCRIRYCVWPGGGSGRRGTVIVVPGRSEMIEKYFEVAGELLDRGFAVTVLDLRGQGLSSRLLPNPLKGHVNDYSDYVGDVRALMDVLRREMPPPVVLLCHSMGGNIALRYMFEEPAAVARAVFTAPMIDINIRGAAAVGARLFVHTAVLLGAGTAFVPGVADPNPLNEPFAENVVTRDEARYSRNHNIWRANRQGLLGPPTLGWVAASFRSTAKIVSRCFAGRIKVPVLIVGAGEEQVVSTRAQTMFVARLAQGQRIELENARHEILMETDEIRRAFWRAFDAFVLSC